MEAVRRTLHLIVRDPETRRYHFTKNMITCEVTGTMSDGSRVWTCADNGKQYSCYRLFGKYFFCAM